MCITPSVSSYLSIQVLKWNYSLPCYNHGEFLVVKYEGFFLSKSKQSIVVFYFKLQWFNKHPFMIQHKIHIWKFSFSLTVVQYKTKSEHSNCFWLMYLHFFVPCLMGWLVVYRSSTPWRKFQLYYVIQMDYIIKLNIAILGQSKRSVKSHIPSPTLAKTNP